MAPRKRSLVWTYFKTLEDRTVQCLLCTARVVHHGPTTTNMMRHLRVKHPAEIAAGDEGKGLKSEMTEDDDQQQSPVKTNSGDNFGSVAVEMDDDETGRITAVDDADITSAINGILKAAEGVAVENEASKTTADGPSLRRRSWVWKHYKQTEIPTCSICLLCMEEIKHYSSASNLKRHLSKKHPGAFAGVGGIINSPTSKMVQQKPVKKKSRKSSPRVVKEKRTDVFDVGDISELEKVRELIEAVRNAQKQEARALEHQRGLLEMLRDANARELAAERERLDRQREELQKEKEELQLKWGQLEQKKQPCTCACQLED